MKGCDKDQESSYFQYWDINNLYGWAMSQKLPANNFEWIKDTSQFDEDFIRKKVKKIHIMKKVMKDTSLKLIFYILKNYHFYHFIKSRKACG